MPSDQPLVGKSFLIFAGPEYEDLELWYPKLRLEEAGADVTLAGLKASDKYAGKHGYPCEVETSVDNVESTDFDGVVCPGGWMPDKLRREESVKRLLREFHRDGKCIAAICHGGWMPISAGIYEGVKATGSPGIKDDLVNAGAIWHDEPVIVDGHFVSSRRPDDLPAFMQGIFQVMG